MTDPTDSITLTREELKREFKVWFLERFFSPEAGYFLIRGNSSGKLAKSFTDTLFTNAKAREEGTTACPYCGGSPYHESNVCRESGYQQPAAETAVCPCRGNFPTRVTLSACDSCKLENRHTLNCKIPDCNGSGFTNAKAREEADKEEASRKVVRDIPGPSLIQSAAPTTPEPTEEAVK